MQELKLNRNRSEIQELKLNRAGDDGRDAASLRRLAAARRGGDTVGSNEGSITGIPCATDRLALRASLDQSLSVDDHSI